MSKKTKLILLFIFAVIICTAAGYVLSKASIPVMEPRGQVARQERNLIVVAVILSAIVVIPVYIMLFGFAWQYRESNKKAKYDPGFNHSRFLESVWWAVPLAIITTLGIITWRSSSSLDPFRPLSSPKPAMKIQAVALQWKWLFIYPEQGIASLNYVNFPAKTPVDFEITSDAPMNSFWIPQLGGQIYAMSGMSTHLNLMADQPGSYRGSSANISGDGFAGMHFTAKAVSDNDFQGWISSSQKLSRLLDTNSYDKLSEPSQDGQQLTYSSVSPNLYNYIVNKYEPPLYHTSGVHTE